MRKSRRECALPRSPVCGGGWNVVNGKMDVVNGKIVASNSKPGSANSDLWSALQPSRSVLESMAGPYPHGNTEAGVGRAFSAVSPPRCSWGAAMAPSHGGATRMAPSMPSERGTGRWCSASKDNILGQPHKQSAAAPTFGTALESPLLHNSGMVSPAIPGATDPQPGWKVPDSGAQAGPLIQSARSKSSRARLDKEMNRYESQLCCTISGHLELPELGRPNSAAEELGLVAHARADHTLKRQEMEEVAENEVKGMETGTWGVTDKKQKMKLFETDQNESSWIAPLRFLVRKVLSVSDVGTLGRIVLPKKDAEVQLPLIDTKEGKLLEMEDYSISKRWTFRYKWWINNKSRMYVLENTGEFIRDHSLKENDSLILYEDGYGKLGVSLPGTSQGSAMISSPITGCNVM